MTYKQVHSRAIILDLFFTIYRNLFSLALLLAACSLSSHANSGEFPFFDPTLELTLEEAEEMRPVIAEALQRFELVRIGIEKAPGMGHQSHSLTILHRLRDLGYDGLVEVVYFYSDEQYEKMKILFPGYRTNQDRSVSYSDNISITAVPARSELDRQADLVIVGGEDISADISVKYRSKYGLVLQPQYFQSYSRFFSEHDFPSGIDIAGHLKMVNLDALSTHITPAKEESFSQFSLPNSNLQGFKNDSGNVRTFAAATSNHQLMVWHGSGREPFDESIALTSIIKTINNNPDLFSSGLLIPYFSRDTENIEGLVNRVSSASIVDLDDEEFSTHLSNLTSGRILFVNVNDMPPDAFQLILRASTLPPIISGKHSAAICEFFAIPYISAFPPKDESREHSLFQAYQRSPHGIWHRRINELLSPKARRDLGDRVVDISPEQAATLAAEMIHSAMLDDSQISILASRRAYRIRQLNHDKLFVGLVSVLPFMNPNYEIDSCKYAGFHLNFNRGIRHP